MGARSWTAAGFVAACVIVALGVGPPPLVAAESPHLCSESILVITSTAPAGATDASLLDALADRAPGQDCVTNVADEAVTVAQAEANDVVVISSSTAPRRLSDRLRDASVPILVSEPELYDDMGLGTGIELGKSLTITIVDPDHPAAADLSGRKRVLSSRAPLNAVRTDSLGPGAEIVAIKGEGRATIAAYPAAAPMVGLDAPAGRVAFFLSSNANLNQRGRLLLDASIDWLLTQPGEHQPTTDLVCPPGSAVVGFVNGEPICLPPDCVRETHFGSGAACRGTAVLSTSSSPHRWFWRDVPGSTVLYFQKPLDGAPSDYCDGLFEIYRVTVNGEEAPTSERDGLCLYDLGSPTLGDPIDVTGTSGILPYAFG